MGRTGEPCIIDKTTSLIDTICKIDKFAGITTIFQIVALRHAHIKTLKKELYTCNIYLESKNFLSLRGLN